LILTLFFAYHTFTFALSHFNDHTDGNIQYNILPQQSTDVAYPNLIPKTADGIRRVRFDPRCFPENDILWSVIHKGYSIIIYARPNIMNDD